MKNRFKDIIDIENVNGLIFLGFDGKVKYIEFRSRKPGNLEDIDWHLFIHSLNGIRETQMVFDKSRMYVRRTDHGLILVFMGETALIEMVRLNCDILIPSLEEKEEKPKGLRRFFKF